MSWAPWLLFTSVPLGADLNTLEGQLGGHGRLCLSEQRVLCGTLSLILSAMSRLPLFVSFQVMHLMALYCVSAIQGVRVLLTGRYEVPLCITSQDTT